MTGQTNTLSNWKIIGGRNECRFQTPPERLRVIVALVRSDGWMLFSPSGGRLYTGLETGDAGKTAADRKAIDVGWDLEGGVFGEPAPEQPKQHTLGEWTEQDGYHTRKTPDGPVVVEVRAGWWHVDGTDRGSESCRGYFSVEHAKERADQVAQRLGWTLTGGAFKAPPTHRYQQPKAVLGVWHTVGGRHVRSRWDKASMVMVHGDGSGWWWSVSAPRPDCGASASDCGTAACLDQAKEQADLSAERFGWSLLGGAFKARPPQAEPPPQAESKPTHRPYRLIIGSRARALREAAEGARSIFPVDALRNAAFDLAWSVEQLDQVREAALKVGEEMAADLEKLERERDEALRERNEAKAARDEALRQVEVERERADTNENLAREAARLTRDFREEVTKSSIAAFNLGWDAAIRCRDILKDTP